MKTSETIDKIISALAKAKSEILSVPMTGRNPFFKNTANPEGSKYSTLDDLFSTVNPVLSKNCLVLTQCPCASEGRISIVTTLFHTSGEWIQNPGVSLRSDKDTPQAISSVITYGKRVEAFAILGLSGDIDDDGQEASKEEISKKEDVPKKESIKLIFQSGPTQMEWLKRNLTNMKVPEAHHEAIAKALHGRTFDDLPIVVQEITQRIK